MTYYLMNKDKRVLGFTAIRAEFSGDVVFKETERFSNVPIGFSDIDSWVENRKASKHNEHLKRIMKSYHCDDHEGFVRLTHAANINDSFWIMREDENIKWEDVSLYDNEFTAVISNLAFGGAGLGDNELFSSTSPELTCDGSFRKCFKKEDNTGQFGSDIYIYKRRGELNNEGLTPYCEMLASEIASIISPDNYVSYKITQLHSKLASKCNLFTSDKIGYASYSKIHGLNSGRLQDVFDYYRALGSEQQFREMLVVDALCFNIDRHRGNFGVLFDNDTLKPICISPVFDLNLSMLYNFTDEDFANVGMKLYETVPKLGDDFTRIGQIAMNDVIAERVRKIKDLSFSFSGDDVFSQSRIEKMLEIISVQASAILSDKTMYIRDTFHSQKTDEYYSKLQLLSNAQALIDNCISHIEKKYPNYYVSECVSDLNDEEHTAILIVEKNQDNSIEIDFLGKSITQSYTDETFEDDCQEIISYIASYTIFKEFEKYLTPYNYENYLKHKSP